MEQNGTQRIKGIETVFYKAGFRKHGTRDSMRGRLTRRLEEKVRGYAYRGPNGRRLVHPEGVTQIKGADQAENPRRPQEFDRRNPSLKASSSQNGLCVMVSERTVAVPSPRFNQTHLYCFAIVTKGPHLGRSEFKGSSQTISLLGWQLL